MNIKKVLSWCTHFDKCFPAHSPCCEYVNNIWGVIDECRPVSCTRPLPDPSSRFVTEFAWLLCPSWAANFELNCVVVDLKFPSKSAGVKVECPLAAGGRVTAQYRRDSWCRGRTALQQQQPGSQC